MNFNVDPLREYLMWRRYAYRFLPSFGGALLLSLSSLAINTTTSFSYYAKTLGLPDEVAFIAGVALCLVFLIGQIGLCEGLRHSSRILIAVPIVSVLLSIPYLGNHPLTLLNVLTLITPLLYLLVLNSKNHRRYTSMLRVKRRRKISAAESFIH
ncbi:hypothetical protein [Pseudomonas sp. 18175]|uniref:hypothetical protein n=1 Tax=Pseudomonas sp. 18175 TaxID=3390056 RepID=UPI003D2509FC